MPNKLDEEADMQSNQTERGAGQVAPGAGELCKIRLGKPPHKLDEEAGKQAKSCQKVPSWMARK